MLKDDRRAYAMHEERAKLLRKHSVAYISKMCKTKDPAILLSSGVDSHYCLFAAMQADLEPVVYSFTLDDRQSKDFVGAKATAKLYGLKFEPIILSTNVKVIAKHVRDMFDMNPGIVLGKATVECLWPFITSMKQAYGNGHRDMISGLDGDIWFATVRSHKKAWEAGVYQTKIVDVFRQTVTAEIKKRSPYSFKGREAQQIMRGIWIDKYAKDFRLILPFNDLKVFDVLDNMDPFKEGNKPMQKGPLRLAFWQAFQYSKKNVKIHMSYNVGDSGISDHFEKLLETPLNTNGYKSTRGIYNDLLRQWLDKNP